MNYEAVHPSSAIVKGKLRYLAALMVGLLILYPFLEGSTAEAVILNSLISGICFLGVYAVSFNRINLIIGLILGVSWFVVSWAGILTAYASAALACVSNILLILFYAYTAAVITRFILRAKRVTGDVLFGAVCVYLLIGGAFAILYLLIDVLQPGAFFMDPAYNTKGEIDAFEYNYFSFATLTTLGYGDIIPVSPHARALAVFEAIMGVMYLAIIISRLVGMYIMQSLKIEK